MVNMAPVEKPATTKEQVDQMWYALIGMNGNGLISKVNRLSEQVEIINSTVPQLVTRDELYQRDAEKRQHRTVSWQYWLALLLAFVGNILNGILWMLAK